MTQPANELEAIAAELDVVATWSSGARGSKVRNLADRLWEQAGGRPDTPTGAANLATPGPGVRSQTSASTVQVDSVGEIADANGAAPVTPVTPTATTAREQAEKPPKPPRGDTPQ